MLTRREKLARMLDAFWKPLCPVALICGATSAIWIASYVAMNGTIAGMDGAPFAPALVGLLLLLFFRAPQDFLRNEPAQRNDGELKPAHQTAPPAKRR